MMEGQMMPTALVRYAMYTWVWQGELAAGLWLLNIAMLVSIRNRIGSLTSLKESSGNPRPMAKHDMM